jgi:hypothetical protein
LWLFVHIFLHEAAHVLVAKLVGLSPFAVTIGKGPALFSGRLVGLDVRVHALPFFGIVQLVPPPPGTRWRGAAYSIAGLLMDTVLLCILLGLAGFRAGPPLASHSTPLHLFFALLAFYQAVVILANLIPANAKIGAATFPNDGKQFLGYLLERRSVALDAYGLNAARYDPAFRIEDSWLLRADAPMLRLWSEAAEDMAAKRYAAGAEKYLRLFDQAALHPVEKAMYLDSLTSIVLFQGEKSMLGAAERWTREAHALLPNCRTIRGTRGAVLVEGGAHAEGLALLMPLTTEGNERIDRALSSCYVAKALHGLGRAADAQEWLKTARSYGEFPAVLARIESEMT